MKAIQYPASLPGVSSWSSTPTMRATMSRQRGLNAPRTQRLERVRLDDVSWDISFAEAVAFKNWFEVDLLFGQRKCIIPLPGAGGLLPRLAQFLPGTLKRDMAPAGYTFTASLIVRRPVLTP